MLSILPKVSDFPPVIVRWADAVIDVEAELTLGEDDLTSFGKTVIMEDVGFLVRQDEHEIVLAVSRCPSDNELRYSISIPNSWVQEIIKLDARPEVK